MRTILRTGIGPVEATVSDKGYRRLLYLVRKMLRGYDLEPRERREVERLLKEWEATR